MLGLGVKIGHVLINLELIVSECFKVISVS